MGYINIFVNSPANIKIKNSQLLLKNENGEVNYPVEDINSIVIDNLETNISTYTLSLLAQNAVLTFITDEAHLPCAVVLPFCTHFNALAVFELQKDLPKPLKKQLWKEIVKNKIYNQNEVLNICGGKDDLKDSLTKILNAVMKVRQMPF